MSYTVALRVAQDVVCECNGDIMWWREQYTRAREFNGIMESIEISLKQQDLYDEFLKHYKVL